MGEQVIHGDCLAVLPTLAEASVDSVVTDPPYYLTNGNVAFDWQAMGPKRPNIGPTNRNGAATKPVSWAGPGTAAVSLSARRRGPKCCA
jgi:DNA modification methylase